MLRDERLQRMIDMGIIDEQLEAHATATRTSCPWEDADNKAWEARRMEVYAAQIDRMDQGIGRIVDALKETGQLDNTLIMFLADNGGCAEELGGADSWVVQIAKNPPYVGTLTTRDGRPVRYGNRPDLMPGGEDTYPATACRGRTSRTRRSASTSTGSTRAASPRRSSFTGRPGVAARGELRHQPAQLPDVMATFLDVAGVEYPRTHEGREIKPLEGVSMTATFADRPHGREVLYFEHMGNRAVRRGKWKLVAQRNGPWELYDMEAGRTETEDLAAEHPETARELAKLYYAWAKRCNVMSWEDLCAYRRPRREARLKARQAEQAK